uniref:Uncharacterized protein n=1 Tax=Arundo donax TaxID=35708 RepID=A0A0A9B0T1_ARUDO
MCFLVVNGQRVQLQRYSHEMSTSCYGLQRVVACAHQAVLDSRTPLQFCLEPICSPSALM